MELVDLGNLLRGEVGAALHACLATRAAGITTVRAREVECRYGVVACNNCVGTIYLILVNAVAGFVAVAERVVALAPVHHLIGIEPQGPAAAVAWHVAVLERAEHSVRAVGAVGNAHVFHVLR